MRRRSFRDRSLLNGITSACAALAYVCGLIPWAPAAQVTLDVGGPDSSLIAAGPGAHRVSIKISGQPVSLRYHLTAWQRAGTIVAEGTVGETELAKLANGVGTFEVNVPQLGLYDLRVEAMDAQGQVIAQTASTFAAVFARKTVGSMDWGVCTHFAQGKGSLPHSLDLVKLAGFGRIRDELYWNAVERRAGVFEFPASYDAFINAANERGLKPLAVLAYANPQAHPKEFASSPSFPRTPETRQLFARYAEACAKHYGSRIQTWEIWNEPHSWGKAKPEEYAELLKAAYPAIKRLAPECTVISCGGGGAGGGPGGDYITGVLQAGALEFQDGFSIHPYMSPHPPESGYPAKSSPIPSVNIPVVWAHLGKFIAAHPRSNQEHLSLWVTEIGWYSAPVPYEQGDLVQAAYLTRACLTSRRCQTAQAVFWYDFQDDGVNPKQSEHNFGLIHHDYSPKPAYVAASTLTWTIGERAWQRSVVDSPEMQVHQFGTGKDAVIAAWAVGPTSAPIRNATYRLMLASGPYLLRDWQGQEQNINIGPEGYDLQLGPMPIYILRAP